MNRTYVKYAAFNTIIKEYYLCNSKVDLAKYIGTSVDTIRRRELTNNDFYINEWYISTNVEIHKQPARNKC